jgi:hypothetical protein
MTQDLFDPLDLEVRRRLRDLGEGPPAPAAARARLATALHLGGPPGGPSGTRTSGNVPRSLPEPRALGAGAPLGKIAARTSTGWILGGAGVAAVVGALLATTPRAPATAHPAAPTAVLREDARTQPTREVAPIDDGASTRSLPESSVAEPRAATPSAPASDAKSEKRAVDLSLAAERRWIEAARSALVAGDPKTGLEKLARHAKQFSRGVLAEEREALSVDALVAAGRYDDALRRAEAFRARYPGSLFAPSVAAALQAIP